MVIYPESQTCGILNSGANCTKIFYLNVSPTTSKGIYEVVGKVNYRNSDNTFGNKTDSTSVSVGSVYSFERVPEEIIASVSHGSTEIAGYVNVTNTGNDWLTVNLSISGGNLSENLNVTLNPKDYKLPAGESKSTSVTISVPLGQDSGEYVTNITIATEEAGNKITFLNITVPVDNSWNRIPDYIDRTGNNSIGVDSTGKFEINISNTGNVDTNFSIDLLNPPSCVQEMFSLSYPDWIFINRTNSDILEINYQALHSGNCVFNIQIKNQEDNSTKIATINASVKDTPPKIGNISYYIYRDINYESQIVRVNITDNHELQNNWAWLNITEPNSNIIIVNMSIEEQLTFTSPYKYTFIGNFTSSQSGTYHFRIYAKDDTNQTIKSTTYQFQAIGATSLEITTNTSREISGITNKTGKCFNQEFNLTNLGSGTTGYG